MADWISGSGKPRVIIELAKQSGHIIAISNDIYQITVTLAGITAGTITLTINGVAYSESYSTDAATTITNWFTTHGATLAALGITVTNPSAAVLSFAALTAFTFVETSAGTGGTWTDSSIVGGTVTTQQPHKMVTGQRVRLMGVIGETPSVEDTPYTITVKGEKTFAIPVNLSVAGTGGMFEALSAFYESSGATVYSATGITETGTPTYGSVIIGMRVSSFKTVSGVDYPTFAKITAKATGVLTIDTIVGWSNGTPTDGKRFLVDGWIADLPYCQRLGEKFEADDLVHELYAGDSGSVDDVKHRGWKYYLKLDYSKYIEADTLISMRDFLSATKKDRLIVMPRVDKPGLNYEVRFVDPVELSRYGRSPGYKDSVFSFKVLANLPSFPIENNRAGYGTQYAQNFGTNL